jgi:hypothetical protein
MTPVLHGSPRDIVASVMIYMKDDRLLKLERATHLLSLKGDVTYGRQHLRGVEFGAGLKVSARNDHGYGPGSGRISVR